jgi:hypothetical protein
MRMRAHERTYRHVWLFAFTSSPAFNFNGLSDVLPFTLPSPTLHLFPSFVPPTTTNDPKRIYEMTQWRFERYREAYLEMAQRTK